MTAGADGVELTTASGRSVTAERAIIATGGFANLHEVLPRKLDISVSGRTIVLTEVSEELLPRLRAMPSLIATGTRPVDDVYILPPIRYPDGRWYIKLGTGDYEHPLNSLNDFVGWFQSPGADEDRETLHQTVLAVIPDLAGAPSHTDTCAVTSTVSGYPYVDLIADGRVCVAVGGNGQAAKSSDEIGRLAARLLLDGRWSDELPEEAFRAHFRD
jgi:sarcosine oxidase